MKYHHRVHTDRTFRLLSYTWLAKEPLPWSLNIQCSPDRCAKIDSYNKLKWNTGMIMIWFIYDYDYEYDMIMTVIWCWWFLIRLWHVWWLWLVCLDSIHVMYMNGRVCTCIIRVYSLSCWRSSQYMQTFSRLLERRYGRLKQGYPRPHRTCILDLSCTSQNRAHSSLMYKLLCMFETMNFMLWLWTVM